MKYLSVFLLIGILIACGKKEGDKVTTLEIKYLNKRIDTPRVQTPMSANFIMTGNKLEWSAGSGMDYKHGLVADSVNTFKVLKIEYP